MNIKRLQKLAAERDPMKRADFEEDLEDAWREAMVKACKLPDAKERMGALRNFRRAYEELEELDPGAGQRIIVRAVERMK